MIWYSSLKICVLCSIFVSAKFRCYSVTNKTNLFSSMFASKICDGLQKGLFWQRNSIILLYWHGTKCREFNNFQTSFHSGNTGINLNIAIMQVASTLVIKINVQILTMISGNKYNILHVLLLSLHSRRKHLIPLVHMLLLPLRHSFSQIMIVETFRLHI